MNRTLLNRIVFLGAVACLVFCCVDLMAQVDLSNLDTQARSQGSKLKPFIQWALGLIFAFGAIKVIIAMFGNDPHAKDGITKWIVAALFSAIVFAIITF